MPYIRQIDKDRILRGDKLMIAEVQNAGELNYAFTVIALSYFKRVGRYQAINDILGALQGAAMEFYRRVVGSYEDNKITENGDVYSD